MNKYFLFQSRQDLEYQIERINAMRPQCPVGLNTLVLPRKNTLIDTDKQPYVYMECGHVHGQHAWGKDNSNTRTCPMCRKVRVTLETYLKSLYTVNTQWCG